MVGVHKARQLDLFLFPPMPSLTRQDTRTSILSWWSDSNSLLRYVNIRAAAKPLMKLMYHRQALEFIRKNRVHISVLRKEQRLKAQLGKVNQ
jgi:hypothetical protein